MKKTLLTLLTALLLTTTLQAGNGIKTDKFAHAFVGLGIYAGCFLIKGIGEAAHFNMDYLNEKTCLIPVVIAGVGKEIYDSQHPKNHTAELMDTIATGALPIGLAYSIHF